MSDNTFSLDEEMKSRTRLLVGDEGMQRLEKAHILLVGVGGVGGAVAHMLVRAGIGSLTLVDGDNVAPSNLNRQMLAYRDTLGMLKTEALAQELRRINPDLNLTLISRYVTEEDIPSIVEQAEYTYVVDAIDTLAPKTALIAYCYQRALPIICAMGAGAKVDPLALRIADISKTHSCALAKAVRKALRDKGIYKGVEVLFSEEKANPKAVQGNSQERGKRSTVGTISYLPNVFGCILASHVLRKLISEKE